MDNKIQTPKMCFVRFLIVAVVLCIVMAMSLSMYGDKFAGFIKKLEDSDNNMDNVIWIAEHLGNILPTVAIVIVQGIVYSFEKNKARANKEQKWQTLILLLFVYIVLLPYQTSGLGLASLGDSSLWFATQFIPLTLLIFYHSQRQSVLRIEAEEKCECESIQQ